MNLIDNLDIRSPLIWVDSDESYRVTEDICTYVEKNDRQVFRMDGFRGLCVWDTENHQWLKVQVPGPEGDLVDCHDPGVAIIHVAQKEEDSIFTLDHAHLSSPKFLPLLHEVVFRYMDAIRSDDFSQMPVQFVLIASVDKVPPEMTRNLVRVDFPLPDAAQLAGIVDFVNQQTNALAEDAGPEVVRAGLGMSEIEFTRSLLVSIRETQTIDPEFVNSEKIAILKRGGTIEVRKPLIAMDSIGGMDNAKELATRIAWIWHNPEQAAAMRVRPARRILLVGVPGSGKSAWCEGMADALGHDLAKTGVSQSLSKWVGESESNMRNAFRQIRAMAPITMWIDEFGRDMSGSGTANDSGTTDRVHGEFLTGLQELPDNVFLVAAANRIDGLPPEMLRADRFDQIMFVGFPTEVERREIFTIHLGPEAGNHDIETLAKASAFFTGAEIKSLIEKASFNIVPVEHRAINSNDILALMPKMKNRVWVNHRGAITEMYRRAVAEWEWASSAQEAEALAVINYSDNPTAQAAAKKPAASAPSFASFAKS